MFEEISQAIVDDLFKACNGDEATHLILERGDGRYLGGWAKGPAHDRIVGILKTHLARKKRLVRRKRRKPPMLVLLPC